MQFLACCLGYLYVIVWRRHDCRHDAWLADGFHKTCVTFSSFQKSISMLLAVVDYFLHGPVIYPCTAWKSAGLARDLYRSGRIHGSGISTGGPNLTMRPSVCLLSHLVPRRYVDSTIRVLGEQQGRFGVCTIRSRVVGA